jgi:hypothetical protein
MATWDVHTESGPTPETVSGSDTVADAGGKPLQLVANDPALDAEGHLLLPEDVTGFTVVCMFFYTPTEQLNHALVYAPAYDAEHARMAAEQTLMSYMGTIGYEVQHLDVWAITIFEGEVDPVWDAGQEGSEDQPSAENSDDPDA